MGKGNWKKVYTIPANPDDVCNCCGRAHRKLYLIDGYKLGARCAEDYRRFMLYPGMQSISNWAGYEKQYNKVSLMVRGK